MRDRTTCGQVMALLLMLLSLIGMAALFGAATPPAGTSMLQPGELLPVSLERTSADCVNFVTPDVIGHEEFERYGVAEKLRNNEFVAWQALGFIVCRHGSLGNNENPNLIDLFDSDMYYIFDRTGALMVTYLEWDDALREHQSSPQPTELPTEAPSADDSDTITVCMDAATPIIEIGGESPQQWGILDILSSGQCAIEMTGPICWDCGEDPAWRWLIPIPTGQDVEATPAAEPGDEMVCIDARTAVQISGQELDEADANRLASDQCGLQIGGGQICWHCGEARPEPTPSPVPTKRAVEEPLCIDYMMPEVIGHEAWEKYGIADRLRNNEFQRHMGTGSDNLICYGQRMIDEVIVAGDELYYRFDIESGQLLKERVRWREDLPEYLPSPLISRQEAEAMAEGEVRYSQLAILSPDYTLLEMFRPSFRDPCWFVLSTKGDNPQRQGMTVINAMTGEVLCRFYPC